MKYNQKSIRMWKILSFTLSVLIRVYWYRFCKKSVIEREKLWVKIGQEFRQLLFQLEGLLIKVGQFLSIRQDLLPEGFVQQIQDLVDHVPPSSWEEIQKELEAEWNVPIEEKLLSINKEVVASASASIGEVFRGKTRDGKDVAIKVQRPTIQSIIRTDSRSIGIFIWFARHFAPVPKGFINFKMLFEELKTVIQRELDFKIEMETVEHFRRRFESRPKLLIPKVFPNLCTSKVVG